MEDWNRTTYGHGKLTSQAIPKLLFLKKKSYVMYHKINFSSKKPCFWLNSVSFLSVAEGCWGLALVAAG
jgi:hypothetical protein